MIATALDEDQYVAAFRHRQEKDLLLGEVVVVMIITVIVMGVGGSGGAKGCIEGEGEIEKRGKDGGSWDGVWRNEHGATLEDYGVDEDAEAGLDVVGVREKCVGVGIVRMKMTRIFLWWGC